MSGALNAGFPVGLERCFPLPAIAEADHPVDEEILVTVTNITFLYLHASVRCWDRGRCYVPAQSSGPWGGYRLQHARAASALGMLTVRHIETMPVQYGLQL